MFVLYFLSRSKITLQTKTPVLARGGYHTQAGLKIELSETDSPYGVDMLDAGFGIPCVHRS